MNKHIAILAMMGLTACSYTIKSAECKKMADGQYFCMHSNTWDYIQEQSEFYNLKNDIDKTYTLAKTHAEKNTDICDIEQNYEHTYTHELAQCVVGSVILPFLIPFCPFIAMDTTDQSVYVNENKETIEKDTDILVCNSKFEYEYLDYLNNYNEEQAEIQRQIEEEKNNSKVNAAIKKYGYKLCVMPSIHDIIAYNMTFGKDCMVSTRGRAIKVFQQTEDGTLIKHPDYGVDTIVFVEKHSKIKQLTDGQYFNGYFVGTGTYQYVTVTGALHTIQKIKYLGE